MGAFGAFAQGFFTKATEIQDENREESRLRRRRAFDLYVSDTLPKIKRAQQQDEEDIQAANQLAKVDGDFKGKWAMSVAAVKWGRKNNQDPRLFRSLMDTIPDLPPEVLREQETSLERTLNFERDANGNINRISGFKDTAMSPMESVPKSQGFGNALMGYSNVGRDAVKGRNEIRAAGYDPDASQTGRFGSVDTGSFSFKPKDPQAEADKDALFKVALEDLTKGNFKDDNAARVAAAKGRDAFIDFYNNPGNRYSKTELEDREYNRRAVDANKEFALQYIIKTNPDKLPEVFDEINRKDATVDTIRNAITKFSTDEKTRKDTETAYANAQRIIAPKGMEDYLYISTVGKVSPKVIEDAFNGDKQKAQAAIADAEAKYKEYNERSVGFFDRMVADDVRKKSLDVKSPNDLPPEKEDEDAYSLVPQEQLEREAAGDIEQPKTEPRIGEEPERKRGIPAKGKWLSLEELNSIPETAYNRVAPISAMQAVRKMEDTKRAKLYRSWSFTPDDWDALSKAEPSNAMGKLLKQLEADPLIPNSKEEAPVGGLYRNENGYLTLRRK